MYSCCKGQAFGGDQTLARGRFAHFDCEGRPHSEVSREGLTSLRTLVCCLSLLWQARKVWQTVLCRPLKAQWSTLDRATAFSQLSERTPYARELHYILLRVAVAEQLQHAHFTSEFVPEHTRQKAKL